MLKDREYDVLIAGGGPAGASAAIHLSQKGARVLVIEQKSFPREKLCGEFISPECIAHFERLGVAEKMMAAGGAPLVETVFYSARGRKVSVPSVWFGEGRGSALGLSRAEMDARLLKRAREAGAAVLEETQAHDLIIEKGRVRGLELKSREGVSFHASALVTIDATGRSSALARHVKGAAVSSSDDSSARRRLRAPLVAFKAHLDGAAVEAGHCEIYFYPGGYGGLSSVENGLSNLCFITRASDVRERGSDPSRLMRELVCLNERARLTLRHARAASPWLSVALHGFGRRRVVPAPGLLAIGDAASFIDPFTGSGMLMALESGETAAQVIARHLERLHASEAFAELAEDYRAQYGARFNQRLRVSSLLRRAAFVPGLAAAAIHLAGTSDRLRQRLARATRNNAEGRVQSDELKS
ncbi:MAG TPA: NAD(P)/FAD-dependent oxidoreductase [Pyrinomonadaceae bacterium]|nr:NAD(P)/FAD-dependent oxidoreductase [Pyrinomonadaceae bacterium]